MYPARFDYYRANSVDEALSLLQQHGSGAKVLAGGHSLLPMMKLRLAQPPVLIDIGRISDLRGIRHKGNSIVIGALTTQTQVAASEEVWQGATALAEAASEVGDMQVRNVATIGGNVAHADPASDIPAAFLALNGDVVVQGPNGGRTIPASDFFQGLFMTSLAENELLTALRVPRQGKGEGSAYVKFENPASGYAIVGVAIWMKVEGSGDSARCVDARIAANGVMDHAVRLPGVEDALKAGTMIDTAGAADRAAEGLSPRDVMGDIHASQEYRIHLLKVITRRAIEKALSRAKGE